MARKNANRANWRSTKVEKRKPSEEEIRIEGRLHKWKRGTIWLGVALLASIVATVPYGYGHPLHDKWDAVGKKILVLSMGLFLAFIYSAATTYNFWWGLRQLKKIGRNYM